MKTIIISIFLLFSLQSNAQAFNGQGSSYTSFGYNISEINCWYKENGVGLKGRFSPIFHGINLQHERALGDYGGLSFSVGAGFARNIYSSFWRPSAFGLYQNDYYSLVIPVGIQYNIHILQWAQDEVGMSVGAENLDVFLGFGIGGGPSFLLPRFDGGKSEVGVAFYGDIQLGLRYYPNENVGYFAQVGYGKSLLNIGVVYHR